MLSLFFAKAGKHIVCGGTTSTLAAEHLGKPLTVAMPLYLDPEIPPTASIEGVDLATEGVITINRVLEYAQDYLKDNAAMGNGAAGWTAPPRSPVCFSKRLQTLTSMWAGPSTPPIRIPTCPSASH